jgi:carboxypeptidase C (cathepsin A)
MISRRLAALFLLLALPAFAQSGDKPAPPASDAASSAAAKPGEPMKNPLPADKSVPQTITVDGRTIHYTATVGTITLKRTDDKATGVVMYTAYTVDADRGDLKGETKKGEPKGGETKGSTHRPVTFALNGGPGASSVYLNLGAIGPKHIAFANEGDSPSDPATLTDNPGTWLGFTDLVFIDPIGTGFFALSRR